MRVIQVTQLLLDFGYLLRGAIEIGPVWHADRNIVGPAYQNAYRLEGTAVMPRVILSETASRLWRSSGESHGNNMCLKYEGQYIVNGLHSYYIPRRFGSDVSGALSRYAAVVATNLNAGLDLKEHVKWEWMKDFVEMAERGG